MAVTYVSPSTRRQRRGISRAWRNYHLTRAWDCRPDGGPGLAAEAALTSAQNASVRYEMHERDRVEYLRGLMRADMRRYWEALSHHELGRALRTRGVCRSSLSNSFATEELQRRRRIRKAAWLGARG